MLRSFVFGALIILLSGVAGHPVRAEQRHALVIGINDYKNITPLKRAVGDAKALSLTLSGLGYRVTTLLNTDRKALLDGIYRFRDQVAKGDTVVVHFSGHGVELSQRNYLLASDIPGLAARGEDRVAQEALALSELLKIIAESGAAIRIFILDACRDDPFATNTTRSTGTRRGLGEVDYPQYEKNGGTFILYSAGFGQAAYDRLGADDTASTSVYTRALIKELQTPNKSILDLAIDVRLKVLEMVRRIGVEQKPAYYDGLRDPRGFALAAVGAKSTSGGGSPSGAASGEATTRAPNPALASVGVKTTSTWVHNGSRMKMVSDGNIREFYYDKPRSLMRFHGWRKGDMLFAGRVSGNEIEGTIRRNSVTCGKIGYRATGHVSDDGARIIMVGRAPRRAVVGCHVKGHFEETLVFTLQ